MAASFSFPPLLTPRPPSPPHNFHRPSIPPARLLPPPLSLRQNPPLLHFSAQNNNGGASENLPEKKEEGEVKEMEEMMASRKEDKSKVEEVVRGVAEEVREIEWPEFGKVVGTTGVVLAVIGGSSVALLTVNAILAEFSDRVFAGKGVQDFFSG